MAFLSVKNLLEIDICQKQAKAGEAFSIIDIDVRLKYVNNY